MPPAPLAHCNFRDELLCRDLSQVYKVYRRRDYPCIAHVRYLNASPLGQGGGVLPTLPLPMQDTWLALDAAPTQSIVLCRLRDAWSGAAAA